MHQTPSTPANLQSPARIPVSPSHDQGDCPLSQPKLTQVYTLSLSGMSLAFKVTIKKGKLDDSV